MCPGVRLQDHMVTPFLFIYFRCKSKRVFITKLELGLPPLPMQRLRRGASNSGLQCLYRVFSREKLEKREFPGWEMSNWLPSVEGLGVGFRLVFISRA